MNRSYSRFVPHSRPVQPRRHVSSGREMVFRPHTAMVSRPVYRQRTVSSDSQPPKSGRSYWFPIATMMAAVLFTVSAIMPRSIFDAFAADEDSFRVGIESLPGSYTVTVTGGNSTGIELPAENALKTVNNDGTVTFRIDLDEETDYAIESTSAMTSVAFGNVEASDTDEEEKNQNDEDAKNEADGEDAEEENEGEEITPRSGAEAIKAIDLSRSGVTTLDISKCTGQTSLNISGTPLEQNASSIVFGNTSGGRVELSVPAFNKVNEEGSCITCIPATETFIVNQPDGGLEIPTRANSLIARAPQSFRLNDILSIHEKARSEKRHDFIDSCSMMHHYGYKLGKVIGPMENIKITTPTDFFVFKAMVEVHENQQIFGF